MTAHDDNRYTRLQYGSQREVLVDAMRILDDVQTQSLLAAPDFTRAAERARWLVLAALEAETDPAPGPHPSMAATDALTEMLDHATDLLTDLERLAEGRTVIVVAEVRFTAARARQIVAASIHVLGRRP